MIALPYWQMALIAYCLLTYIIGWFWFRTGWNATVITVKVISVIAWLLSPILIPIGLAFLFLTH